MSDVVTTQPQTVIAPAPTVVDPAAILTPSRGSTYDQTRREKLQAWAKEPVAEVVEPVVDDVAATTEAQGAIAGDEPETPLVESGVVEATAKSDEVEAPTQVEAAVETEEPEPAQPAKPKPYAPKAGEQDFDLPEDLTLTYKADGAERTRSIDEVVRYAQLGENFDRRSRELADAKRSFETESRTRVEQSQQEIQAAYNEFYETARRFAEDDEFREEFLEEYSRLKNNPQELEIRMRAQKADVLERQLNEIHEQRQAAFDRKVWGHVDEIIGESLSDFDEELKPNIAKRVRERFHTEYGRRGREALSDAFVQGLVREEREMIDTAVARARADVEATLGPQVKKAKAEAVVETKNKITDAALNRQKQAAATPARTPPTPATRAAPKITSARDAKKALDSWANS